MSDKVTTEWGGFFITPNIIIDDYGANLGVYGLAVYMALARYANQDGESFPAVKTIATVCDCSENKVREAIKHMVRLGLLRVEERSKDSGGQTSNLYTLLTPPTHQVKPPPSQDEAPPLHTVNPNKTHIEQDSSKDSLPSPAGSEKPSHKKRDLLFEMVCSEVLDFEYKPGCTMPKSLQGLANGITADLRTIEGTPQELRECMQAWNKEHGKDFSRPKARGKVTQAVLAYREKRKPTPTQKPAPPRIGLDITPEEGNQLADTLEKLKAEMEAKRDAA
jgi:hypothetical protein